MKLTRQIKLYVLCCCLVLCLFFVGCITHEKADAVFTNGKIFTVDKNNPLVDAIAVKEGKILALGSNADIERFIGTSTQTHDLSQRLVVPGFIDAHVHLTYGAHHMTEWNLKGMDSIEKIQEIIAAKVKELPEGAAIRGYGYDNNLFPGRKWPTKEDLDEAAPHNSVVIRRWDGHSIWVNSVVLRDAGITKDTPDPQGGVIEKDPKTGEPTGILKETAMSLIKVKTIAELPPTKEVLQTALEYASRLGLTGIQTSSTFEEVEMFKELNEEGRLPLRIYAWLPYEEIDECIEKGIRQSQGDDMVKIGFLKLFIDGVIDAQTALLFKVFPEDPDYDHLAIYPEEEFYAMVERAHKLGFQVGTHAIGDKGVNWCLNAVERAQQKHGKKDLRHRIEHTQVIHFDDADRFGELGVIASMQPTHLSSDMNIYHTKSRKELAKRAYAWRTLIDNGATLAFGTDWPVEGLNPVRSLYCCVTRKKIETGKPEGGWIPEQKISLEEAIKYQTLGPAYAAFEEDIKGSLEVGKLADMVVLSKDLFSVEPAEILNTKVLLTILGGKIVYSSKQQRMP